MTEHAGSNGKKVWRLPAIQALQRVYLPRDSDVALFLGSACALLNNFNILPNKELHWSIEAPKTT